MILRRDPIWRALSLSVAMHILVFSIQFKSSGQRELSVATQLEVVLVNSKTLSKPSKAEFLAQANLDGGGNTDAARRARTPLPVLPNSAQAELSIAAEKVATLEQQSKQLLTQLKSQQAIIPDPPKTDHSNNAELPLANELQQKVLEALRLEAAIAREHQAYQQRPKRKFIGSRAGEYRFARYVEDWRLKIERIGNQNYPETARQQKIYGSLVVTVAIMSDGQVESVEISRSSGKKILDAAALRIVQLAAPYAPFPLDIRRDTDILHITRTWTFTRGDALIAE